MRPLLAAQAADDTGTHKRMGRTNRVCSACVCCGIHADAAVRVYCRTQKFVMQPGIPVETATKVYRRYLKLEPTHVEEYIAYLKKKVRAEAFVCEVIISSLDSMNPGSTNVRTCF